MRITIKGFLMSEAKKIIWATLHHYGLTTARLSPMLEWYAPVLGIEVVFASSRPLGKNAPISVSAAWVTDYQANHRIGLIARPALV
jgi:hypothetical protein